MAVTEQHCANEKNLQTWPDNMEQTPTIDGGSTTQSEPRVTTATAAAPAAGLTRAESNRRNALQSTGPRSEAGKARSRFNALKHGMAARSPVLPGEDPAEFEANRRGFHERMNPRDALEALVVDCIADDAWSFARVKRAASAQLAHTLRNQPLEQADADREQVVECGRRLLKDLAERIPGTPADRDGGPGHPGRLLVVLERTVTGCDWLLGRWRRLMRHLITPEVWRDLDGLEMLRLLGYFMRELDTEDDVALVLLTSKTVVDESGPPIPADTEPVNKPGKSPPAGYRWDDILANLDRGTRLVAKVLEQTGLLEDAIDDARLRRFVPRNVDEARRTLERVIDEQTRRLEQVRAVRARVAEANAADLPARLAAQAGPEGRLERRYSLAHRRTTIRTIDAYDKIRKAGDAGAVDPSDLDQQVELDDTFATARGPDVLPIDRDPPGQDSGITSPRAGPHIPQESSGPSPSLHHLVAERLSPHKVCAETFCAPNEAKPAADASGSEPAPKPHEPGVGAASLDPGAVASPLASPATDARIVQSSAHRESPLGHPSCHGAGDAAAALDTPQAHEPATIAGTPPGTPTVRSGIGMPSERPAAHPPEESWPSRNKEPPSG
jgi:hypothetical protein